MKDYSVKKFLKEQKEAAANSRAASKKVDIDLAHQELNDVDFEYIEFKEKNGELVEEKSTPIADFRRGIATSLKNAGVIDAADVEKVVNDVEFNKATAESYAKSANMHVRDYISTGRFYNINGATKKDARTVLFSKSVDAKNVETTKIVKHEDGTYTSEPTGDTVRTEKHTEIAVKNKLNGTIKHKLEKK